MRTIINLNEGWSFCRDYASAPVFIPENWESVTLPHTWNGTDGQDGGGDYFRGKCCYVRKLPDTLPPAAKYYLEICGANSSAEVFLNGKSIATHDGGYSTWRTDISEDPHGVLSVVVDNAPNDRVYPQVADFTFYGGLYRDVNVICVPESHFDLTCFGGPGIHVTPTMDGSDAKVAVEVRITGRQPQQTVRYTLLNAGGTELGTYEGGLNANFRIKNAHRWHGRKNPYLYSMKAELMEDGQVLDTVSTRFGCRSFSVDPNRGFLLNGEEYPLRGVSRHQDRPVIGNALRKEHHLEDMALIQEVGATTIRLAHYQHDQYFYDLCDETGMVVWAEIPYISNHMPGGRENTVQQMKELIIQNYNHPSIVVWGLSNEITMSGASDPDLMENHKILNDLCHTMDKTRLTTMAVLSMCSMDEKYVHIPDTVSYNHYFGWYGGDTSMNGPWFDKFHATYPTMPIGCSEYGCEALDWHTSDPKQGDYTEEYQAHYHEELIRQLFSRKYLWATHVWNMFDFAADARAEGGENGMNHKGLVTFDRQYKKDAFYAYKAWLSDEPFVHICGKRYTDRVEDVTKVTVYSNQPTVELFANGESLGCQSAEDHFFYFSVPNAGETALTAVAGSCRDESVLRKVDTFNESYRLKEQGAVLNWFDITEKEGYLSLNSTMGQVMSTPMGKVWFAGLMLSLKKKMDASGKKDAKGEKKSGFSINLNSIGSFTQMLSGFTVLRLTGMVTMVGVSFTKEELLKMNRQLNRIKAPK